MKEFKVYNRNNGTTGKTYVTSVFFNGSWMAEEVKRWLTHDGSFSPDIIVRKYTK